MENIRVALEAPYFWLVMAGFVWWRTDTLLVSIANSLSRIENK